jgi:hypothetical protein
MTSDDDPAIRDQGRAAELRARAVRAQREAETCPPAERAALTAAGEARVCRSAVPRARRDVHPRSPVRRSR